MGVNATPPHLVSISAILTGLEILKKLKTHESVG
jgi:hypothetical protein